MEKELALRTFAYLIGHYKTHEETIINSQEIEAINYILDENERLETQLKKQKEIIDKTKKLIKQYGKYDGQKCTRGFQMWIADFNKLLQLLEDKEETDINVGEV